MASDHDGDGPPLRREDAKPAAGDDLRAAPFTDHVFDDDYYGRSGKEGNGRSYGLVLGVVLGTAIALGVGYFAFQTSGGPSTPGGEPPVIQAERTPYKIKPDDPGGLQVANQDKLVYERVAKGDAPRQVENLLPPAEVPNEPPPKPTESESVKEQPAIKPVQESEVAGTDPLARAVAEIADEENRPVNLGPNSAPSPAQNAPVTTPSPQQTASLTVPDGAYLVQLAAARSNEGAEGEWKRLSGQHADLLGKLNHMVLEADLGDRGVFYRLRVGPLDDRSAAEDLCAALTEKNVGCIVVRP